MSKLELNILTDEDGYPWAAFVYGDVDFAAVAAAITPEAVEDATGFNPTDEDDLCLTWPPRVQTYWLREQRDQHPDEGDTWEFCKADDKGAQQITGHRFYPQ